MLGQYNKRSGIDRRSGNDRRTDYTRSFFNKPFDKRTGFERRETEELRSGWVRVSRYSSAYLGFPVETLHWPLEKKQPNVVDYIKDGKIDLVINIPKNYRTEELSNGYLIRRAAVDCNVMLITNRQIAMRFLESLAKLDHDDLKIRSWQEYFEK